MDRLFVRVDGSTEIGLGHFVRCVALAQVVNGLFDISFVSMQLPQLCLSELESNGFSFSTVNTEAEFVKQLKSSDVVIIDGYHFDTDYEVLIKSKGCRLLTIDDLFNRHFSADGVINHGLGIDPSEYSKDPETTLFLGTDYLMVRDNFYDATLVNRTIKKVKNVYVNMGGSDPDNITLSLLKNIDHNRFENIHVVLGAANDSFERVSELVRIKKLENIHLHYNLTQLEMEEVMRKCELALCTPSGVAYELCCVGIGLVVCKTRANQEYFYKAFIKLGLSMGVEMSDRFFIESLLEACYTLSEDLHAVNRQVEVQKKHFSANAKINLRKVLLN